MATACVGPPICPTTLSSSGSEVASVGLVGSVSSVGGVSLGPKLGVSAGGWAQLAGRSRVTRMPAIKLFFISASEVTLWLEFYTTGGAFSIVCDEIAVVLLKAGRIDNCI